MPNDSGPAPARKPKTRYRRQLRSRIILAFVLLGFGLTALFAYATNLTRSRVRECAGRGCDEPQYQAFAEQFARDPPESGVRGQPDARVRLYRRHKFDSVRLNRPPEWYGLSDGIHGISGRRTSRGSRSSSSWPCARPRRRGSSWPTDMSQTMRGRSCNSTEPSTFPVVVFTLLSLVVGMWAASARDEPGCRSSPIA
jgi:hypothetical protein